MPDAAGTPAEPRLVVARYDADGSWFACGFSDGSSYRVRAAELGMRARPAVVWAEPDECRGGVVVLREDGTLEDFAADLVLYLRDPTYRASQPLSSERDLARRVGVRVRGWRLARRLTQRALARKLGMAPQNLARLEAGRHAPSVALLVRLASALSVPLDRLVARK